MKFLNDVTITGSGADLSCAATVTFSNLPTSSEVVSVMINSSGVLSKRTLGLGAFKGIAAPTSGDTSNVSTAGAIYTYVTDYAMPIDTVTTKWNGGSTGLTASTGRTSLGATTVGGNLFTLSNPGAIRFPRFNANNTVSSLTAADFRTAIGAGTSSDTVNTSTVASALADSEIAAETATSIRTNLNAQTVLQAIQIIDWSSSQTQNIHANNYTNTTYSVGDGGLTQNNFTNTLKSKLDGIDASANNYTLTAATNLALGGVLFKSATTQSVNPNQLTSTSARTYAIQKGAVGGAMCVNVPWTTEPDGDTDTKGKVQMATTAEAQAKTSSTKVLTPSTAEAQIKRKPESFIMSLSGETTDIAAASESVVAQFYMPYNFTITDVKASAFGASAGAAIKVDIAIAGESIFNGDAHLTIDAGEFTSASAADAYQFLEEATTVNVSTASKIDFIVDQIGSEAAGKGLKVYIIGYQQ